LYFEAECEDEDSGENQGLRKVGYSKERRVDPQIVVGLLVNRGGFPLEIGCFEGNKAETKTLLPVVQAFQACHGLDSFVVVADAGMLSNENLKALDEAGFKFIVGSKSSKAPHDLESHFHWHGDLLADGQIIDTVTPRHANARVNNKLVKAEPAWNPSMGKSWRVLWQYSAKRAKRDAITLEAQRRRALDAVDGIKPARRPRFVKTTRSGCSFDEKAFERAQKLEGLKGYVTNLPATLMPATEVIDSYHELWHVEQSFRMSKTDLRARPIFHRQRDAIDAHLTVVMAALAVSRYLHQKTGITAKKLVRILRPIQEQTTLCQGHEIQSSDPITPQAQKILDKLGH
ncbi:IS1634 family transposase, partial [Mobiluncus mulieris]|uniref:IS1634 family transposase n=1 Tax=Mobiluncus mulieris TaxID=2052 RepID=UPI0021E29E51